MGPQQLKCSRILIWALSLSVFFTETSSDEQGKVAEKFREAAKDVTEMFTNSELSEKIKDLLEKRPELPDSPDFDDAFKAFFGQLDSLAVGMNDDFEFDVKQYGPPEGHRTLSNINAMRCLNNGTQFKHFIKRVHEILQDLREDYLDDHKNSKDVDDSRDNDTASNRDREDFKNNSTDDSWDHDSTTESPDSKQDSRDDLTNSTELLDDNKLQEANLKATSQNVRRRRDIELQGYDLDDILDNLEDDDVECLTGFLSNGDKKFLCHRFAKKSPGIFAKIMAAGADCDDYLKDSKEKDDVSEVMGRNENDKSHEAADDSVADLNKDAVVDKSDEKTTNTSHKDSQEDTPDNDIDKSDEKLINSSHNISKEKTQDTDVPEEPSNDLDNQGIDGGKRDDDDVDDDDDDLRHKGKYFRHDYLGVFQQLVILKQFKEKGSTELSDDDIKKVLTLAPDVIDDDFLEDLPEELFKQNLHTLGRLAAEQTGNPRLRYALREKLGDLNKLSADDIREIGPGLLSLSLDQIKSLDGKLFLDSSVDIDKDDSQELDSKVGDHDDDDDEENDDIKVALGQRIKDAIKKSALQKQQIGRALHFLHHDLAFVRSIDPDDLVDVLDDIQDINYDFDDARSVLDRLIMSPRFPPIPALNGYNLTHMGKLLKGMDVELLALLNKESIKEALDSINDIDFDDYQAHQLLENLEYSSKPEIYTNINAKEIRKLGKLFHGMPTNIIMMMKKDTIEEALDDFDDLDLSDAMKKTIAEKVRNVDKISSEFLGLDNFAEVVSLDDLDDFDDDDIKMYVNVSSQIKWRQPQAALLAQRYKAAKGTQQLKPKDLTELKLIAPGLLPDDLDDMMVTKDDVFDVADKLRDVQDDLTSGQIDELVENLSELSDLTNKNLIIDELQAIQAAHVLASLTPELFDKLEFTKAGKLAFLSQVAKMPTYKMSRQHIEFLAKTMLEMLEDLDSAEYTIKPVDRESRRLRSLGQMALGLTPSQIKGISGLAIIDNLDILRTLPLTKEQAKAVLEKVEEAVKDWKCHIDILVRVGALLQHLDDPFSDDCDSTFQEELPSIMSVIAKSLEKRREMVQKRLDEGFGKENDDATDDAGEKRLIDAMVLLATQKLNVRKRRATSTENGALTCDVVVQLKNLITVVDTKLLISMPKEEVKKCLSKLGAVHGFPPEVLKGIIKKITLIYPDLSTWSTKLTSAAGSTIAGLSVEEIQQLNGLNGVDVLQSIGKHGQLSSEQLKAGLHRWMVLNKKNNTSDITGGELSSMSEFVCGLEPAEISRLKDTTFKRSLDTIGNSVTCTDDQRKAYLAKGITVYGSQINHWSPAVVAEMGHLLGSLNDDQIRMLTAKQLAFVPPKTIQALPKERVAALTKEQLMVLSTNQANSVSRAQYDALTAEQQRIITSKASISFTTQESKPAPGVKDKGNNGASEIAHFGFLTLVTAILACVFV